MGGGGWLEVGQAAQASGGLALQLPLGLVVAAQGGTHGGHLSGPQGEDAGLALLADRQGGGGYGVGPAHSGRWVCHSGWN